MKIMQINCVYRFGSTGKIVYDIHTHLKKSGVESLVYYGRGEKCREDNVKKVSSEVEAKLHSAMSRLFGVDFAFSPISTRRTILLIQKEHPDVVHLHCLNAHFINVYRLVEYLKAKHIKTVLTLHAEIMHTAGCEHSVECKKWKTGCHHCGKIHGTISRFFRDDALYCYARMQRAFSGFEELTVVGVSQWLTDRAKQSPIFRGAHFATVHNGVNAKIFHYYDPTALRNKLDIPPDKKIILHVTPNFNHPIKGGQYVLELATRLPDNQFVIIGFNGDPKQLSRNILPISHISNQQELAMYYSMANLTLLTSKRETFSMVCAESLCCGTPVVGFLAGGPESIALPSFSRFVESDNTVELQSAVQYFLQDPFDKRKRDSVCVQAQEAYSIQQMVNGYKILYKN